MNMLVTGMTGNTGYGSVGNEFIYNLYNEYTKNIELTTIPDYWIKSTCDHPQYKSMMIELMSNHLDDLDLWYFLWIPEILTMPAYTTPTIIETMFETDGILNSWVDNCNKVEQTWVPSKFCEKTFKDSGVENVKYMPFGLVFNNDTKSITKLDNDPRFKFLFINQYSVRKNAKMTIQAFLETFSKTDNVVLYVRAEVLTGLETAGFNSETILKDIQNLKMENPDSPQVIILDRVSDETLHQLYNSIDVLIAPSSGEGLGKTIAEAMSHSVPVITTNWSAPTEFVNDSNGFLLDYTLDNINLSDIEMKTYFMTADMKWANPEYLQLCEYMSYCFDNPNECKILGTQAKIDVRKQFDWKPLMKNRIAAIEAII